MSASSSRRVVITGIGLVSPLGNTAQALAEALAHGRSGIRPLKGIPTDGLPTSYGGEARDFSGEIADFGPLEKSTQRSIKKGLKVMCREIQMGVAAAQMALSDSGIELDKHDRDRIGVLYGSDYIMTQPEEFSEGIRNCLDEEGVFQFGRWAEEGLPKITPLWLLKYLPNMPASHIAIYNDLRGPNNSLTLREASANLAIGEAYCTIARGSADAILAGATGTRIHPLRTVHVILQEELAANGQQPEKMCRPFDLQRTGMVLGEGASAILLEEIGSARARDARILGEIVGHASSTVLDRNGVAQSDVAVKNVLNQSLRSADMAADEVGHIHAHGLATHKSDVEEAAAIDAVFGKRARPVPVTAAKSYFGNLGAAGGMIELIASLLAQQSGNLFPILNYETPDPQCPIAAVREAGADPGDSFINVNVTPQGQAAAVVVRKFR